jgi:hypothetical protein
MVDHDERETDMTETEIETFATWLYDSLIASGAAPSRAVSIIQLTLSTDGLSLPLSYYRWLTG